MPASVSSVLTLGLGPWSDVNLLVTLGFGSGAIALEPIPAYRGDTDWTMLLEDAALTPSAIPSIAPEVLTPSVGPYPGTADWSHDPRRGD